MYRALHTVHAEAKSISVLRCSSYVCALVLLCLLTSCNRMLLYLQSTYMYVCFIGTLLYWRTSERLYVSSHGKLGNPKIQKIM